MISRLSWSGSGAAGGYVFAHDPDIPVREGQSFWLPELSPGTLILGPAPPRFEAVSITDPNRLGALLADYRDADGHEWIINDGSGELHIRLPDGTAFMRPAVLLPAGADYALRLDVARRFMRRLHGKSIQLLPPALRIRPPQRRLFIQLLHTADVVEAGGGPREVASLVLKDEQAFLPSIEWKDSPVRKQADRLIGHANALVESEYLKILQGH